MFWGGHTTALPIPRFPCPLTPDTLLPFGCFVPFVVSAAKPPVQCSDGSHNPPSLTQGNHHPQVVLDLLKAERAPLAILEPLLQQLVATDLHAPIGWDDAAEPLRGVDCYALLFLIVARLFDHVAACHLYIRPCVPAI